MIFSLIGLSVLVVSFLIYQFYQQCKDKSLFKKVAWCVTSNSLRRMLDRILYLQYELEIDEKYKIANDECSVITDILKTYREDLVQKYFNDSLPTYKFIEEVCFVLTLGSYLEKHQCDITFNDNEMYTVKDYKTYGTWGVTSFSATYALTDYAVTYHKLLYITQLYYLKLYKIDDRNKLGVIVAETTKGAMDNRELEVNNF